MIPVLAVPILNRPDLLIAMLASVDEPVRRVYVIDNGDCVPEGLASHICRPGANLGVAASWNLAIRANITAPWWLMVNADVVFAPGDLAQVAAAMEQPGPRIVTLLAFAAFAFNAEVIDAVGWFDEDFGPMYFEDSDWCRRASLLGIPAISIGGASVHAHETTISSNPDYHAANRRTEYINREHYLGKWGGLAGAETYATPWNNGGDLRTWPQPSVARLREQQWP